MPEMSQLQELLHQSWQREADKIASLDEQLNTDGGTGALARDAIAALGEPRSDQVTNDITRMVDGLSGAELLAVDTLIRRVLRKVAGQVKTYVEANKTEAVELAPEVVADLRAQRKVAVEAANALRVAAKASDPTWANTDDNLDSVFPEFANLRGAGPGSRTPSPRFKGSYAWAIDGKPLTGDKIADVAKKIGVTNPELKNALNADWNARYGTDFPFGNDQPASFEFTFTHGDASDEEGHQQYRINAEQRSSDDDDTEDDEVFDEVEDTDEDIFDS